MDYNKTIQLLRDRNSQLVGEIESLKKQLEEINNENNLDQTKDTIHQTLEDYSKRVSDLSNIKSEYQEKMDELKQTILSLKEIKKEQEDLDDTMLSLKMRI